MHRLQRGNSSRRGRAEGLTRPSFQQCSCLCIPPPCQPRVVARDLAGFWMAGVLLFFNPVERDSLRSRRGRRKLQNLLFCCVIASA